MTRRVLPKESWIVGMEVVMWRYVPRVVGCVSWIMGKEVANMRSNPGEPRSEITMSIWEFSIRRKDGRISS